MRPVEANTEADKFLSPGADTESLPTLQPRRPTRVGVFQSGVRHCGSAGKLRGLSRRSSHEPARRQGVSARPIAAGRSQTGYPCQPSLPEPSLLKSSLEVHASIRFVVAVLASSTIWVSIVTDCNYSVLDVQSQG